MKTKKKSYWPTLNPGPIHHFNAVAVVAAVVAAVGAAVIAPVVAAAVAAKICE